MNLNESNKDKIFKIIIWIFIFKEILKHDIFWGRFFKHIFTFQYIITSCNVKKKL